MLPNTYWGGHNVNFALRGEFTVPPDFDPAAPVALFLPLGDAGSFAHPEALAYIDGVAYATTDRFHQEFRLPDACRDGWPHAPAAAGMDGQGSATRSPWTTAGACSCDQCAVVQIDQPTRDFLAAARNALQAANVLDDLEPAKTRLLNALDAAFKILDTREPFGDGFYASVPAALDTAARGHRPGRAAARRRDHRRRARPHRRGLALDAGPDPRAKPAAPSTPSCA